MDLTEKLYWSDSQALSFETRGALLGTFGGRPSLILRQTLFYPEGGGQLGDVGTMTVDTLKIRVADTQIEDGAIHHVLDGEPDSDLRALLESTAAEGVVVRGSVDELRRRDFSAAHTAQHALSRALANAARADTVSARLGSATCTIDIGKPGLSDADLHRAEDLVNAIVMSDVPVVTTFPSPDALAKLDLRKQPNAERSQAGVRVVSIEGFDLTPCGGTHCTRTGQIGQVRITRTEKYKGMLRLTFHAGRRALVDARSRHELVSRLATDLTCGPDDLPTAIAKLRGEMKGLRDKLESSRVELASLVAERLLGPLPPNTGPHVVAVARDQDDLGGLRALAMELTKNPRVVALVAGADEGSGEVVIIVQRGADTKLDCGAFVSAETKARGGRGGGRPERAEGRFPKGTALAELARAATSALAG